MSRHWVRISLLMVVLGMAMGLAGCALEVKDPVPESATRPLTVPWPVEPEDNP